MSTEHQQYSIANQTAAIQEYADAHSIEIVRSYVDSGRSGLALEGRPGLQNLISTVASGAADFTLLLVYDVSRWGRFQDVDESAYQVAKLLPKTEMTSGEFLLPSSL
jgi:DNA invertase Pin-like site-specific DNA recombinase